MPSKILRRSFCCVLPLALGCSSSGPAASGDAGVPRGDAGKPVTDAKAADAKAADAHKGDARTPEASTADSTSADVHTQDAHAADSAPGDASSGEASRPDASPATTRGGAPLPAGWTLKVEDRFGTAATQNVRTMSDLHAKYYEGQFYNRNAQGLVDLPNVVINNEQETYEHFETVIVFATDHLTIQGRGHADGSITSGEMVSIYRTRSFCIEGRYQIPSTDKSWPAFWWYGDGAGNDKSEIDVEQPITPNQGVHDVSLNNHPTQGTITILDPDFTTAYMNWHNPSFDGSTAPHVYTGCYDDAKTLITRYIDGVAIYSSVWQWNASLGGTGHGPDPATITNLAVGGDWTGNVANPSAYSADLDVYSIGYYGP